MKTEDILNKIDEIKSSDPYKAEDLIRKLGYTNDKGVIPKLLEMLSIEKDIGLKNAIALSLGDLKADEAVPKLMEIIKTPENKNKRGSFLYALINLDCRNYFIDFVELICTGSYEVCRHSFVIFESLVDEASFGEKLEAKKRLGEQIKVEGSLPPSKNPKYDRIHFIKDALELLSE